MREREEEVSDEESDAGAANAPKKRGAKKKRYEKGSCPPLSVYQFFHIEAENERGYNYRCILSHASPLDGLITNCVGPTNLLSHMKALHGFVMARDAPATKEAKQAFFASAVRPRGPTSKEKTTSLLLQMIIRDLRPFSVADGPGFSAMLEGFGAEPPSAHAIALGLDSMYVSRVLKLKELLGSPKNVSHFSVSIDGWKLESKGVPMYCMVIHFLTETFELLALPLEVSVLMDKTAAGIKAWIRAAFAKLGLSFNKLMCVTSDEAKAEECATALIGCYRVPCVPHRLSNVVKTAFVEASLEAKEHGNGQPALLVEATKKLVRFINNRKDIRAFHDAEREQLGIGRKLQLYCKTRFIGSLLMGKIFMENKAATDALLTKCALEDKSPWTDAPAIKEEHWLQWDDALLLTKSFNDVVEQFSGAQYVTVSHILPVILELRFLLRRLVACLDGPGKRLPAAFQLKSDCGDKLLRALVARLDHYFDKDHENPVILVACVLDPRYRDWSVKANAVVVQMEGESAAAFEERIALKQQYREMWNMLSEVTRKSLYSLWKKKFPEHAAGEHEPDWHQSGIMRELNVFCQTSSLIDYSIDWIAPTAEMPEPPRVTNATDVLKWWKCTREFWRLKLVARAVLSVPASAISCERTWSTAGRVFTKLRGSLKADTGAKQIMLHELAKAEERCAWLAAFMNN